MFKETYNILGKSIHTQSQWWSISSVTSTPGLLATDIHIQILIIFAHDYFWLMFWLLLTAFMSEMKQVPPLP